MSRLSKGPDGLRGVWLLLRMRHTSPQQNVYVLKQSAVVFHFVNQPYVIRVPFLFMRTLSSNLIHLVEHSPPACARHG